MAKWLQYTKRADFKGIGEHLGVDQVIARIMVNRGLDSEEQMQIFLHPDHKQLLDGGTMKDMAKAVSLLRDAILQGKHIRVVGDYDIDGVCSTYICIAPEGLGLSHAVSYGVGIACVVVAAVWFYIWINKQKTRKLSE